MRAPSDDHGILDISDEHNTSWDGSVCSICTGASFHSMDGTGTSHLRPAIGMNTSNVQTLADHL